MKSQQCEYTGISFTDQLHQQDNHTDEKHISPSTPPRDVELLASFLDSAQKNRPNKEHAISSFLNNDPVAKVANMLINVLQEADTTLIEDGPRTRRRTEAAAAAAGHFNRNEYDDNDKHIVTRQRSRSGVTPKKSSNLDEIKSSPPRRKWRHSLSPRSSDSPILPKNDFDEHMKNKPDSMFTPCYSPMNGALFMYNNPFAGVVPPSRYTNRTIKNEYTSKQWNNNPPSWNNATSIVHQTLVPSGAVVPDVPCNVAGEEQLSTNRGCTCKKSRCLKLYCECFASGVLCGPHCKCEGCGNGFENQPERIRAMQSSKDKTGQQQTGGVSKGRCNCKRSGCLKKYCDCYKVGLFCSDECGCKCCLNRPESQDQSSTSYQISSTTKHELSHESHIDDERSDPPPPPPLISSTTYNSAPPPPYKLQNYPPQMMMWMPPEQSHTTTEEVSLSTGVSLLDRAPQEDNREYPNSEAATDGESTSKYSENVSKNQQFDKNESSGPLTPPGGNNKKKVQTPSPWYYQPRGPQTSFVWENSINCAGNVCNKNIISQIADGKDVAIKPGVVGEHFVFIDNLEQLNTSPLPRSIGPVVSPHKSVKVEPVTASTTDVWVCHGDRVNAHTEPAMIGGENEALDSPPVYDKLHFSHNSVCLNISFIIIILFRVNCQRGNLL
eukprot:GHVL01011907.1.p1 GENE.GHVL01011907.1~~GHVL01011907.1.p1  ORF type:complete len:664 (+),score=140.06 GHVL01011907.1:247-2238(+)